MNPHRDAFHEHCGQLEQLFRLIDLAVVMLGSCQRQAPVDKDLDRILAVVEAAHDLAGRLARVRPAPMVGGGRLAD